MGKHLVLVGAGHAHLTPLARVADYLNRGHRVTLVNPFSHTYYSGMGPGLLSGLYRPGQARFNVRKMAESCGAAFIEDTVSTIDAGNRRLLLKSGQSLDYDIASFNCGSVVSTDPLWFLDGRVFPVKPVINLYRARSAILSEAHGKNLRVVVAGGGPAGVEVAGNLWRLFHDKGIPNQLTLVAGERLLSGCPAAAGLFAGKSLRERSIAVYEGKRVLSVSLGSLSLSGNETVPFDYAFLAVGTTPSTLFWGSGLRVARDGSLPVNRFLQSIDHPEFFGGGDCICLEEAELARVGVHAVRQSPILHHNLLAALDGREMNGYTPREDYMLILNMGNSKGLLFKRGRTFCGRLPFLLKDFIDNRFMRKFQISGELDESI